jgi:D-alanyl-D-alanine carboxypeptidase
MSRIGGLHCRGTVGVVPLEDALRELSERLALHADHVVDVRSGVSYALNFLADVLEEEGKRLAAHVVAPRPARDVVGGSGEPAIGENLERLARLERWRQL